MKRIFIFLLSVAMLCGMTSAFAAPDMQTIDLGNGYYMVVSVHKDENILRASSGTDSYTAESNVYSGSTKIGKAYLEGIFSHNGSTAKALGGSASGSGLNGWNYKSGSASYSGASVYGTFYFDKGNTTSPAFKMTMTCSPDGSIKIS